MVRKNYFREPPVIDWDEFVVNPSHPRPRDKPYHDVLDALDRDEMRTAGEVKKRVHLTSSEVSRALRLLVLDQEIIKSKEGNPYGYPS